MKHIKLKPMLKESIPAIDSDLDKLEGVIFQMVGILHAYTTANNRSRIQGLITKARKLLKSLKQETLKIS